VNAHNLSFPFARHILVLRPSIIQYTIIILFLGSCPFRDSPPSPHLNSLQCPAPLSISRRVIDCRSGSCPDSFVLNQAFVSYLPYCLTWLPLPSPKAPYYGSNVCHPIIRSGNREARSSMCSAYDGIHGIGSCHIRPSPRYAAISMRGNSPG
jgi:hypothetical protein